LKVTISLALALPKMYYAEVAIVFMFLTSADLKIMLSRSIHAT